MSDAPLFQDADEQESIYAPHQLPAGDRARVVADGGGADVVADPNQPPAAAPVASVGSSPSSSAAPPNIGDKARGGAPGDPETQARYPLGDDDRA